MAGNRKRCRNKQHPDSPNESLGSTHSQSSQQTSSQRRKRRSSPSNEPTPSTSRARKNDRSLDDDYYESGSQKELQDANFQNNVNKCIRYLLLKAGTDAPFRKSDLTKHALVNPGKQFLKIIAKVQETLSAVYGYELIQCKETAGVNKIYYLCNALEHKPIFPEEREAKLKQSDKILALLILSHIMMTNGPVSENSLQQFLRGLRIDANGNHRVFGNVQNCVAGLAKQKYLTVESNNASLPHYKWGPRAASTVSKLEVLKFVCKFYGNRPPESWPVHFAVAMHNELTNGENDFSDDD